MATKKKVRCPLRNECERTCNFEFKELECDYYRNNAVGESVLSDQEEIRVIREKRAEEEMFVSMSYDDDDTPGVINVADLAGSFSEGSEICKLMLGVIIPSPNNYFKVEDDITELAEDIKVNGLLTPLTVTPSENEGFYRLISGHRRYKALCSIYENSFEVPCLVTKPKSPEAEEYMLIRANTSSRVLSYSEINDSREKAEDLLLKLKSQGVEFPGKLRTHVANLLRISEAKLAKVKYIAEHTIDEIKGVSDDVLSFDSRWKIAHWPEDMQKALYDKKLKDRVSYYYDIGYLDSKIKDGEDPFAPKPPEEQKKTCYYNISKSYCDNVDNLTYLKDSARERFGVVIKCGGHCCWACPSKCICPQACETAKNVVEEERLDYSYDRFYTYRTAQALRYLLESKGYDQAKIVNLSELDGYELTRDFEDIVRDPYDETFEVCDLLWYLNKLKITPNEFFAFVLERTEDPRDLLGDERIPFEIYLGEDKT